MKRWLICIAAVFALFAGNAKSNTGWFAKWNCTAPCELAVDYFAMPESEQVLIQAEMDKWNLTGVVHMYPQDGKGAKIILEPCDSLSIYKGNVCGFITYPKFTKQNNTLHSADVQFSSGWFGWEGMPQVYCHELGHTLGFLDGAVEPDPNLPPDQTSTSCMSGTGPDPGIEDFNMLVQMYG